MTRRFISDVFDQLPKLPSIEARQSLLRQRVLQAGGAGFAGHTEAFVGETTLGFSWIDWATEGHQVLVLPAALAEAFGHSRISELRIRDVLPSSHGAGYLAFEDCSIALPGLPGAVEGLYWRRAPEVLTVLVVGRDSAGSVDPHTRGLEGYRVVFLGHTFDMPADAAIQRALEDDVADLERARAQLSVDTQKVVDRLVERHRQAQAGMREVLGLLLNALAFRSAYPQDVWTGWPADAPVRLVDQANQTASPKTKARAESKLWHLGWSRHTVIGPAASGELGNQLASHGTRRAHWRVGHWRNQAAGPGFSLRRLIWIRPTLVGAASADDPAPLRSK